MSKSIDNRVVQMTFENRDFEKGAQESLSTLEKLKNSLSHLGDGKAFNLDKIDTSGLTVLSDSVDEAGKKFSWLQEIAIGALRDIGRQAKDLAVDLVKGVTIDPISAGWTKYNQEVEAVQTLMAATRQNIGTGDGMWADQAEQMEAIEAELDKILWYTDETSYKYTDMVRNIAKFTANGFGLEEGTDAMIGIAGLASVAGVSIEGASHAMDVFSKAMSRGYFQLGEWRQLEDMNFVTYELKENLIQTALEMGKIKKIGVDAASGLDLYDSTIKSVLNQKTGEGGFTVNTLQDALTKGRIADKELLGRILGDAGAYGTNLYKLISLTGDYYDTANQAMSGVEQYKKGHLDLAKTFKVEGEELEELTKLYDWLSDEQNEASKVFFTTGQEAKTLAEAWGSVTEAASTQWMSIFKSLFGGYLDAKEIWTKVANEGVEYFIGPLYDLSNAMGEWVRMNGQTHLMDAFGNMWEGVLNITDSFGEGFAKIFPEKTAEEMGRGLTKLTIKFRDFTKGLKENETIMGIASSAGTIFGSIIRVLSKGLEILAKVVWIPKLKLFAVALDLAGRAAAFLADKVDKVIDWFEKMTGPGTKAGKLIRNIGKAFDFLLSLPYRGLEKLSEFIEGFKGTNAFALIAAGAENAAKKIKEFASPKIEKASKWLEKFKDIKINFDAKAYAANVSDFLTTNETVQKVVGKVNEALEKLGGLFVVAGKKFGEFVGRLRENQTIQKIGGLIVKAGAAVVDFILAFKETPAFKTFASTLEKIWNAISMFAGAVFMTAVGKLEDLSNMEFNPDIEGFANTVSKFAEPVAEGLKKMVDGLFELGETVMEFVGKLDMSNFGSRTKGEFNKLTEAGPSVEGFLNLLNGMKEDVKQALGIFWQQLKGEIGADALMGAINNPFKTIQKMFKKEWGEFKSGLFTSDFKIDWNLILGLGGLGGVYYGISSFNKMVNSAKKVFDGLKVWNKIPESFAGAMGELKNVFVAYQTDIKSNVLLKVAIAIGVLVGSFIALTRFADFDKLIPAAKVLGGIGLAIGGFALAMAALQKVDGFGLSKKLDKSALNLSKALTKFAKMAGFGLAMSGFAIAIGIIVLSLGKLNKLMADPATLDSASMMLAFATSMMLAIGLLSKYSGDMKGLGKSLLAFAASLGIMIAGVAILGMMPWDTVWHGAIIIGALSLALGGAIALVKKGDPVGFAAAMIVLAGGLFALIYVIKDIDTVPWQGLVTVGALVLMTVGSLTLAAKFIQKYKLKAAISELSFALIAFGASILLMTPALMALQKVPFGNLVAGGLLFVGFIVALVGAAAIMRELKLSDELGVLATVLGVVALSILAMTPALYALQNVGWGTLIAGGFALVALIGALVGSAALLQTFGLSDEIGVMVIALLALGAALFLMAPALDDLGNAWPGILALGAVVAALALLGGLSALTGGALGLAMLGIAAAIGILGIAALAAGAGFSLFANGLQTIATWIVPLAMNFLMACQVISNGASAIGEAAYNLITSIALGIGRAAPVVAQTVTTLMASVLLGILQGLVEIVTVVIPAITQCLNQITVGLYQNWEPLKTAVWNFIQSLGFVVKDALLSMVEKIPGANLLFGDWIAETKESINRDWAAMAEGIDIGTDLTSGLTTGLHGGSSGTWAAAEEVGSTTVAKLGEKESEAEAAGGGIMDKFTSGMMDKLGDVEGVTSLIGENGLMNLEGFGDMFNGAGGGLMDQFTTGFGEGEGGFMSMIDGLGLEGVSELTSFAPQFKEASAENIEGVTQAIADEAPKAKEEVHDLANMSVEELMLMAKEYYDAGDTNAGDYIKGIVTQKMKAQFESASMAVDAAVAAREKRGEFESSGEYCGGGFGGGIRNSIGSAVSAAGEMARSALSTIKSVLGVASPSKEFMYIGEFSGEGFSIGLQHMIGEVRNSAKAVADESLIAMQETMNNLSDGIDENLDMSPVIRPVLDLSDVQNGSASLNNMLGMQSLHASANGLGPYSAYDKEARLASMLNQQESTPTTTMNFTIYGAEGQDVREIAEAVRDIINHELERGKVGVLA